MQQYPKSNLKVPHDQGREMAEHAHRARQTGRQVYFAHHYSPWERSINENTHGLLQEYLPKAQTCRVADKLLWMRLHTNSMPGRVSRWAGSAQLNCFCLRGFKLAAYWQDKLNPVTLGA